MIPAFEGMANLFWEFPVSCVAVEVNIYDMTTFTHHIGPKPLINALKHPNFLPVPWSL